VTDDPLDAVLAHPDDDGPRLVYADWLEERGDADRAEFVRLQLRLAQSPTLEDRAREAVLLHRHAEAWLAPLRVKSEPLQNRGTHAQFVRGFVEIVWMPAQIFLKRAEKLFHRAPVRELRVTRANPAEFEQLILFPPTARLHTIDLSNVRLGERGMMSLADAELLKTVRVLRLRNCHLGDDGATDFANTWFDWPLTELDVTHNPLSESAVARLRARFGDAVRFGETR
jgi:uncharacterized protein (TIGR02996 family)